MTIFIDNLRLNTDPDLCPSDIVCHLCTDGPIENLHTFVRDILGFKDRQWFDDRPDRQHYDIDADEALIALRAGAIQQLFYRKSIVNTLAV